MEQSNSNTKTRKWQQITEPDRYKIEGYLEEGLSITKIARLLKRSRRTIGREVALGRVEQRRLNPSNSKSIDQPMYLIEYVYKADYAQMRHDERASNKGRNLKIGHDHKLADYIEHMIKHEHYSPDAIIGRIHATGMKFDVSICVKTLYSYIDKHIFHEVTNSDLWVKRNQKKRDYKKIRTVALNNRKGTSIAERPECANDRTEKGHWEIDLVVGMKGTRAVILTLVERKTRKSLYILVRDKTQKEVIKAIKKARKRVGGNFDDVFKTITADNGVEFLDFDGIKKAGKCDEVYYAHPYSSWERGSNENGNRILRRFIPKKTDIGKITAEELQRIEDWVNNYPRKIFGYQTANEMAAA